MRGEPGAWSPSFSFRTMDHRPADVFINGHLYGSTSFVWSVTDQTVFDPKIPVPVWPPPGAKFCGSGTRLNDDGTPASTVELYLEGGHYEQEAFDMRRRQLPHLVEGEQILYVRAGWGRSSTTGAVRVRVVGKDGAVYRWVDYVAYQSDEDENASRFKRALWHYAVRPE